MTQARVRINDINDSMTIEIPELLNLGHQTDGFSKVTPALLSKSFVIRDEISCLSDISDSPHG